MENGVVEDLKQEVSFPRKVGPVYSIQASFGPGHISCSPGTQLETLV